MNRRAFIVGTLVTLTSSSLILAGIGDDPFYRQLRTQYYKLKGTDWLQNKRIISLADIHYGSFFGPQETKILSKYVATLNPDLIIFPGDLANDSSIDLSGFLENWNQKCPQYFAPGNHDIPKHVDDPHNVITQIRASAITVLNNSGENFADFNLIGMTSGLKGKPNLNLIDQDRFNLIISHEPDLFDQYHGNVLQLAGHTHGGQIQIFGKPICLPELGTKYSQGFYTKAPNNNLIVSRGVGSTSINLRIGCPPEVVVIDFV